MSAERLPTVFLPHGGGPWPFVDMGGMLSSEEIASLRTFLADFPRSLPARPKALLVISAHWEARRPTVSTSKAPPMFYDYGGFPPESYRLRWPAPGDPHLARRVRSLLEERGFASAEDDRRGFDHGTFIPLMVAWPQADIPTVQLSLRDDFDPAAHLEMGRALAPLRDEGVLIVGSGMTFHDLRSLGTLGAYQASVRFDAWLQETMAAPAPERDRRLAAWASAPSAREAHPRAEHFLPLLVAAGAASGDDARPTYHRVWGGAWTSGFEFGEALHAKVAA